MKKISKIIIPLACLLILIIYTVSMVKMGQVPKPIELPAQQGSIKPSPYEMVDLQGFIPGIVIDLRYASGDNVFGKTIYEEKIAWLRQGTALKLKAAQEEFVSMGYSLKVWDAYRMPDAQYKLWEVMPDPRYVVNPNQGFSYHSRGVAVDVTLVDEEGNELWMPSEFDNFTALADRDYSDVDKIQAENAGLLEKVMVKHGFKSIFYEWWHFADFERDQYDVIEHP